MFDIIIGFLFAIVVVATVATTIILGQDIIVKDDENDEGIYL